MSRAASAGHRAPHAAALALCARVRDEIEYAAGAIGVQTDAVQAWSQRRGFARTVDRRVTIGVRPDMG